MFLIFMVFVGTISLLGVPISFDPLAFVEVLLAIVILHVAISIGVIYCEREAVSKKITAIRSAPKMSMEEYKAMVKRTTAEELAKLKESEEFKKYIR